MKPPIQITPTTQWNVEEAKEEQIFIVTVGFHSQTLKSPEEVLALVEQRLKG